MSAQSQQQAGSDESDQLRAQVAQLTAQMEDLSMSQAKKYAVKKELARAKANLIREQRKQAQAQQ